MKRFVETLNTQLRQCFASVNALDTLEADPATAHAVGSLVSALLAGRPTTAAGLAVPDDPTARLHVASVSAPASAFSPDADPCGYSAE